jgi:hypothetical protein
MSSLKNRLIKLAYSNPSLRGDLLPLIIKKYANVGTGTFAGVAEDIANERNLTRDEDKNQIQEDLKNTFEEAVGQLIQQNLKKPAVFPQDSIDLNLDFARGIEIEGIYKKTLENGSFVLNENPEDDTYELIEFEVPKGFTGSFYLILDLSHFDGEVLKKYVTKKLEDSEQGGEEEVVAESSLSQTQARKKYTEYLQNRKDEWEKDVSDAIADKINNQKTFFDGILTTIANSNSGDASKKIPPTLKGKIKANVKLSGEYNVKKIERIHADGKIECLVTLGGELTWGTVIVGNNKAMPVTPASQPQNNPMSQSSQTESTYETEQDG